LLYSASNNVKGTGQRDEIRVGRVGQLKADEPGRLRGLQKRKR